MGILSRILGAVSREELKGISLDLSRPFWELSGETGFPEELNALVDWLPEDCVLYFEGGWPSREIERFLKSQAVPGRVHVACGTIWPRPRVDHVPATPDTLRRLAELMERHANHELAIHFHVYRNQTVLLEWHDAFAQPMLLSGEFPESQVKTFAERLKMSYDRGELVPRKPK